MERTSRMMSVFALSAVCSIAACKRSREAPVASANTASSSTAHDPAMPGKSADPSRDVTVTAVGAVHGSSGAVALAREGPDLLAAVVDEDEHALRLMDAQDGHERSSLPLPGRPGHVVVHEGYFVVALRDRAELVQVALEKERDGAMKLRARRTVTSIVDPLAMHGGPAGALVVVGAASAEVQRFDKDLRAGSKVSVGREPRAIVVDEKGLVTVAHATASQLTTIDLQDRVTVKDISLGEICTAGTFDECMTTVNQPATQSFALATIGNVVLVPTVSSLTDGPFQEPSTLFGIPPAMMATVSPELKPPPTLGATASGYGGGNRSNPIHMRVDAFSRNVPAGGGADVTSLQAGRNRLGTHDCTLPRGMSLADEGRDLFLACLGEGRVDHYVLETRKEKGPLPWPRKVASVAIPHVEYIAFDTVTHTGFAYAAHARRVYALRDDAIIATADLPPTHSLSEAAQLGRQLFHDTGTRISRGKKACASCHPDGGDDGFVWQTDRGRRRTLPLAGRLSTGRLGWNAQSLSLRSHINQTIRVNLHGKGLREDELDALGAYISAMNPPPPREGSTLSARGKEVFESSAAQCSSCHAPATGFSNGRVHDVKSDGSFKTPSLYGLRGRTRFFHDGRYKSLEELLVKSGGTMGGKLEAADRAALVAYLETL